jgi:hypothetical protein
LNAPVEEEVEGELETPATGDTPLEEVKETPDIVAALRKELEESKQAEHKLKSDAGRVPSLQRKLAELDKKLADISANPTKSKDASGEDAPPFTLKSEAMDALRSTDPELAKAIEEGIASAYGAMRQDSVERTREITSTFMESAKEEFYETEWAALTRQVPNAKDVVVSEEWKSWREQQTPGIKALADSDYASDVVMALRMFAGVVAPQQRVVEPDSKVHDQRESRLRTVTPNSGSKSPASKPRETEQSLFNKIYQETINQSKRR